MNRYKIRYTPEQIIFLKENCNGRPFKELTKMFNERFGLNRTEAAITVKCNNLGFKNGITGGQFKPGHKTWNAGLKGYKPPGMKLFQKGHITWNKHPVGHETIDADGYISVKIADPSVWKKKHVKVWEDAHGAVPDGHIVIFANGNNADCNLENLLLVSRAEFGIMNIFKLTSKDADATRVGKTIADIKMAITKRGRK